MKTGIATVSISGDLKGKLEAIASAGYDGVEIFEQDFIASDIKPSAVGQMVREHGLEIMLFQPFRDFEGLPEPYRSKAFDRAERKFDLMCEMGTDLVLVCSSCHPQALGGIDRAAEDFHKLGERAAKRGLRVGYEALAWGRYVDDHRDAWEIVRRAEHENVGLILDSFHTLSRGIDPETIRRVPGDKIFFVQLADAPAIPMDLLYWSRHFRNMPGEGDLPVVDFMRCVMATGYDGPISLEIFNDQFRTGAAPKIAQDGYRSLLTLMDDVRKKEPAIDMKLQPMPPRAQTNGMAFVEFAAQGEALSLMENQLSALGFANAGRHKNKNVTLWQQGEIRIVLNAEESGHAGASFAARGLNVCDMGLNVDDASAVVLRAKRLGIKSFSQPIAENEVKIPAIEGLAAQLIHFIDPNGLERVWTQEFGLGQTHKGAGLKSIDHIAHSMSYEDMLSWSLFYTALFDMKKAPMVDVFDPDGLVRSQAVEARDYDIRVTLNGAENNRTLAGQFVGSAQGASVQHLAFATDDIFATMGALFANGFAPLIMPENYYADLVARFDFPEGLLEKLQANNILYDQDEYGRYFQAYSKPLENGFFFEIVQRTEHYQGYGAPNSAFRIAAQKRANGLRD